MKVPITPEREEITELFSKGKYEEMEKKFGIILIERPSNLDCGGYVLNKLNVVANEQTYKALWEAQRYDKSVRGIILYTFKGKKRIEQHGIYDGDMVTSKWYREGPVFKHRIEDVPADFGDFAEFVVYTPELMMELHAAEHAPKSTEEEY